MLEKGPAIIRECPERYQMTSLRWMDSSKVQMTSLRLSVNHVSHGKTLCCSPTLLTLPLKIRVPPANATHLYIIILQLLNILITSYGKYQILPNPHNTAQFNHACPAAAQFNHACPATAQFNYACPATAQFNYACPATAQFNHACPATAQFNYACPATAQFNYACPATAQFNYACPATAQFNSRTLLPSSCQPL